MGAALAPPEPRGSTLSSSSAPNTLRADSQVGASDSSSLSESNGTSFNASSSLPRSPDPPQPTGDTADRDRCFNTLSEDVQPALETPFLSSFLIPDTHDYPNASNRWGADAVRDAQADASTPLTVHQALDQVRGPDCADWIALDLPESSTGVTLASQTASCLPDVLRHLGHLVSASVQHCDRLMLELGSQLDTVLRLCDRIDKTMGEEALAISSALTNGRNPDADSGQDSEASEVQKAALEANVRLLLVLLQNAVAASDKSGASLAEDLLSSVLAATDAVLGDSSVISLASSLREHPQILRSVHPLLNFISSQFLAVKAVPAGNDEHHVLERTIKARLKMGMALGSVSQLLETALLLMQLDSSEPLLFNIGELLSSLESVNDSGLLRPPTPPPDADPSAPDPKDDDADSTPNSSSANGKAMRAAVSADTLPSMLDNLSFDDTDVCSPFAPAAAASSAPPPAPSAAKPWLDRAPSRSWATGPAPVRERSPVEPISDLVLTHVQVRQQLCAPLTKIIEQRKAKAKSKAESKAKDDKTEQFATDSDATDSDTSDAQLVVSAADAALILCAQIERLSTPFGQVFDSASAVPLLGSAVTSVPFAVELGEPTFVSIENLLRVAADAWFDTLSSRHPDFFSATYTLLAAMRILAVHVHRFELLASMPNPPPHLRQQLDMDLAARAAGLRTQLLRFITSVPLVEPSTADNFSKAVFVVQHQACDTLARGVRVFYGNQWHAFVTNTLVHYASALDSPEVPDKAALLAESRLVHCLLNVHASHTRATQLLISLTGAEQDADASSPHCERFISSLCTIARHESLSQLDLARAYAQHGSLSAAEWLDFHTFLGPLGLKEQLFASTPSRDAKSSPACLLAQRMVEVSCVAVRKEIFRVEEAISRIKRLQRRVSRRLSSSAPEKQERTSPTHAGANLLASTKRDATSQASLLRRLIAAVTDISRAVLSAATEQVTTVHDAMQEPVFQTHWQQLVWLAEFGLVRSIPGGCTQELLSLIVTLYEPNTLTLMQQSGLHHVVADFTSKLESLFTHSCAAVRERLRAEDVVEPTAWPDDKLAEHLRVPVHHIYHAIDLYPFPYVADLHVRADNVVGQRRNHFNQLKGDPYVQSFTVPYYSYSRFQRFLLVPGAEELHVHLRAVSALEATDLVATPVATVCPRFRASALHFPDPPAGNTTDDEDEEKEREAKDPEEEEAAATSPVDDPTAMDLSARSHSFESSFLAAMLCVSHINTVRGYHAPVNLRHGFNVNASSPSDSSAPTRSEVSVCINTDRVCVAVNLMETTMSTHSWGSPDSSSPTPAKINALNYRGFGYQLELKAQTHVRPLLQLMSTCRLAANTTALLLEHLACGPTLSPDELVFRRFLCSSVCAGGVSPFPADSVPAAPGLASVAEFNAAVNGTLSPHEIALAQLNPTQPPATATHAGDVHPILEQLLVVDEADLPGPVAQLIAALRARDRSHLRAPSAIRRLAARAQRCAFAVFLRHFHCTARAVQAYEPTGADIPDDLLMLWRLAGHVRAFVISRAETIAQQPAFEVRLLRRACFLLQLQHPSSSPAELTELLRNATAAAEASSTPDPAALSKSLPLKTPPPTSPQANARLTAHMTADLSSLQPERVGLSEAVSDMLGHDAAVPHSKPQEPSQPAPDSVDSVLSLLLRVLIPDTSPSASPAALELPPTDERLTRLAFVRDEVTTLTRALALHSQRAADRLEHLGCLLKIVDSASSPVVLHALASSVGNLFTDQARADYVGTTRVVKKSASRKGQLSISHSLADLAINSVDSFAEAAGPDLRAQLADKYFAIVLSLLEAAAPHVLEADSDTDLWGLIFMHTACACVLRHSHETLAALLSRQIPTLYLLPVLLDPLKYAQQPALYSVAWAAYRTIFYALMHCAPQLPDALAAMLEEMRTVAEVSIAACEAARASDGVAVQTFLLAEWDFVPLSSASTSVISLLLFMRRKPNHSASSAVLSFAAHASTLAQVLWCAQRVQHNQTALDALASPSWARHLVSMLQWPILSRGSNMLVRLAARVCGIALPRADISSSVDASSLVDAVVGRIGASYKFGSPDRELPFEVPASSLIIDSATCVGQLVELLETLATASPAWKDIVSQRLCSHFGDVARLAELAGKVESGDSVLHLASGALTALAGPNAVAAPGHTVLLERPPGSSPVAPGASPLVQGTVVANDMKSILNDPRALVQYVTRTSVAGVLSYRHTSGGEDAATVINAALAKLTKSTISALEGASSMSANSITTIDHDARRRLGLSVVLCPGHDVLYERLSNESASDVCHFDTLPYYNRDADAISFLSFRFREGRIMGIAVRYGEQSTTMVHQDSRCEIDPSSVTTTEYFLTSRIDRVCVGWKPNGGVHRLHFQMADGLEIEVGQSVMPHHSHYSIVDFVNEDCVGFSGSFLRGALFSLVFVTKPVVRERTHNIISPSAAVTVANNGTSVMHMHVYPKIDKTTSGTSPHAVVALPDGTRVTSVAQGVELLPTTPLELHLAQRSTATGLLACLGEPELGRIARALVVLLRSSCEDSRQEEDEEDEEDEDEAKRDDDGAMTPQHLRSAHRARFVTMAMQLLCRLVVMYPAVVASCLEESPALLECLVALSGVTGNDRSASLGSVAAHALRLVAGVLGERCAPKFSSSAPRDDQNTSLKPLNKVSLVDAVQFRVGANECTMRPAQDNASGDNSLVADAATGTLTGVMGTSRAVGNVGLKQGQWYFEVRLSCPSWDTGSAWSVALGFAHAGFIASSVSQRVCGVAPQSLGLLVPPTADGRWVIQCGGVTLASVQHPLSDVHASKPINGTFGVLLNFAEQFVLFQYQPNGLTESVLSVAAKLPKPLVAQALYPAVTLSASCEATFRFPKRDWKMPLPIPTASPIEGDDMTGGLVDPPEQSSEWVALLNEPKPKPARPKSIPITESAKGKQALIRLPVSACLVLCQTSPAAVVLRDVLARCDDAVRDHVMSAMSECRAVVEASTWTSAWIDGLPPPERALSLPSELPDALGLPASVLEAALAGHAPAAATSVSDKRKLTDISGANVFDTWLSADAEVRVENVLRGFEEELYLVLDAGTIESRYVGDGVVPPVGGQCTLQFDLALGGLTTGSAVELVRLTPFELSSVSPALTVSVRKVRDHQLEWRVGDTHSMLWPPVVEEQEATPSDVSSTLKHIARLTLSIDGSNAELAVDDTRSVFSLPDKLNVRKLAITLSSALAGDAKVAVRRVLLWDSFFSVMDQPIQPDVLPRLVVEHAISNAVQETVRLRSRADIERSPVFELDAKTPEEDSGDGLWLRAGDVLCARFSLPRFSLCSDSPPDLLGVRPLTVTPSKSWTMELELCLDGGAGKWNRLPILQLSTWKGPFTGLMATPADASCAVWHVGVYQGGHDVHMGQQCVLRSGWQRLVVTMHLETGKLSLRCGDGDEVTVVDVDAHNFALEPESKLYVLSSDEHEPNYTARLGLRALRMAVHTRDPWQGGDWPWHTTRVYEPLVAAGFSAAEVEQAAQRCKKEMSMLGLTLGERRRLLLQNLLVGMTVGAADAAAEGGSGLPTRHELVAYGLPEEAVDALLASVGGESNHGALMEGLGELLPVAAQQKAAVQVQVRGDALRRMVLSGSRGNAPPQPPPQSQRQDPFKTEPSSELDNWAALEIYDDASAQAQAISAAAGTDSLHALKSLPERSVALSKHLRELRDEDLASLFQRLCTHETALSRAYSQHALVVLLDHLTRSANEFSWLSNKQLQRGLASLLVRAQCGGDVADGSDAHAALAEFFEQESREVFRNRLATLVLRALSEPEEPPEALVKTLVSEGFLLINNKSVRTKDVVQLMHLFAAASGIDVPGSELASSASERLRSTLYSPPIANSLVSSVLRGFADPASEPGSVKQSFELVQLLVQLERGGVALGADADVVRQVWGVLDALALQASVSTLHNRLESTVVFSPQPLQRLLDWMLVLLKSNSAAWPDDWVEKHLFPEIKTPAASAPSFSLNAYDSGWGADAAAAASSAPAPASSASSFSMSMGGSGGGAMPSWDMLPEDNVFSFGGDDGPEPFSFDEPVQAVFGAPGQESQAPAPVQAPQEPVSGELQVDVETQEEPEKPNQPDLLPILCKSWLGTGLLYALRVVASFVAEDDPLRERCNVGFGASLSLPDPFADEVATVCSAWPNASELATHKPHLKPTESADGGGVISVEFVRELHAEFSPSQDGDLLACAEAHGADLMSTNSDRLATRILRPQDLARFPSLADVPVPLLRARLVMLRVLQRNLRVLLCHADLSVGPGVSMITDTLRGVRRLVSTGSTHTVLQMAFRRTLTSRDGPTVELDRVSSMNLAQLPPSKRLRSAAKRSLFMQLFKALRCASSGRTEAELSPQDANTTGSFGSGGARLLRVMGSTRPFKVDFVGESAQDAGGPYRDLLSALSEELENGVVPLFTRCPNAEHEYGEGRDAIVPQRECRPAVQRLYEFVGQLMGLAMRTAELLPLSLPPLVWKRLTLEPVDKEDVLAVDRLAFKVLDDIERLLAEPGMTSREFDLAMDSVSFKSLRSGCELQLTWSNREQFAEEFVYTKLHEYDEACAAIRRGLVTVVPGDVLSVLPWQRVQVEVGGEPDVDVQRLRRHTQYPNCTADQPFVEYFWEVLEHRFTREERQRFLQFVWGRSRLPLSDEYLSDHAFKLKEAASAAPDKALPVAQTCFFSLSLPPYSSAEVMYERLKFVIEHARTIDADNVGAVNVRSYDAVEESGADADADGVGEWSDFAEALE